MQLAWVVTDVQCNIISQHDFLVKGEHRVSRHVPHSLTRDYVNAHGTSVGEVMAAFFGDVRAVVANQGRMVAHNASYDLQVMEYALAGAGAGAGAGAVDLKPPSFCSMSNPKIIQFCALPCARARRYKFPKLAELYEKCHAKPPPYTLHDAMGDVMTLRDSMSHLLEKGIISFAPRSAPPPDVVASARQMCDLSLNASDVGVVAGMLLRFDKHPFEVAQRVLEKFGGVLGRAFPPPLRPRVELGASFKAEVAQQLRETPSLEQCVEAMSEKVAGADADDVKRCVRSEVNCAFGAAEEAKVVETRAITCNNSATYYLYGGTVGHLRWGFVGRVDGFLPDGRLVEIKNRTKRLFRQPPDYERMQCEIYMRMTGQQSMVLLQRLGLGLGAENELDLRRDDEVWDFLVTSCGIFFEKLLRLVRSEQSWARWCESEEWAARAHVWESV
jgi:DNA polymerase III epsilon subunit-like protein